MVRPLLHPVLYEPRTTKVWYQPLLDLEPYAGLVAQDEYIGTGQWGLAPWSPDEYGQMVSAIKPLESQTSARGFSDIQAISAGNRRGPIYDGRSIKLYQPVVDNNPYVNSALYLSGQFSNYIQQKMWYERSFSVFVKADNIQTGGQIFGGLNNVSVSSFRLSLNQANLNQLAFEIGNGGDPYARLTWNVTLADQWAGFVVVTVDKEVITMYANDEVHTYDLTQINKNHTRRYFQSNAQNWIIGTETTGGNAWGADVYAAAMFDRPISAAEVAKLKTIESNNTVRKKITPFEPYQTTYPRMFTWLPENNLYSDVPYSNLQAPWTATNGAWAINATAARNPIVMTKGYLKFDGVDDRLYLSNLNPNTCAPKRTMIVRARNLDGGTIVSTGGTNEEFYIRFPNNNTVEFHYNHATEGVGVLSGPASDGTFHVIAVVIDETKMKLYVDGVEVDSVPGASWHFNTGNKRTTLGARYNGTTIGTETDFFEGIVSHLIIVDNDAVTPSEVVDMTNKMVPDLAPIMTPALPPFVYHEYDVLKLTGLNEGDFGLVLPDTQNGFDLEAIHGVDNDIYKPIYRENAGDYGYPALEFVGADNRLVRQGFQGSPIVGGSYTLMMLWKMETPSGVDCRFWSKSNPNVGGSPTVVRGGSIYYEVYPFPGWAILYYGKPFEEDLHLQTMFASKAQSKIFFSVNFDNFKESNANPYNGFPNDTDFVGLGRLGPTGTSPLAYFYGAWLIPGELTEQQYQDMRTYIKARFPKLFEGNVYV